MSHPLRNLDHVDVLTTPSAIGNRSEAAVASALVRAGVLVYLPAFGADGRVDLVYIDGLRTVRVQCKTARRIRDVLYFRTCSNTANVPLGYDGEVDEFGVYSADTGLTYLVPVGGLPTRLCSLRLSETRNGQSAGIRWARDYELGPP